MRQHTKKTDTPALMEMAFWWGKRGRVKGGGWHKQVKYREFQKKIFKQGWVEMWEGGCNFRSHEKGTLKTWMKQGDEPRRYMRKNILYGKSTGWCIWAKETGWLGCKRARRWGQRGNSQERSVPKLEITDNCQTSQSTWYHPELVQTLGMMSQLEQWVPTSLVLRATFRY